MKTYQTARGVRDILPSEQVYWNFLRRQSEEVFESLGILRIDLPHFENAEIFSRGLGVDTDIIQKEMYMVETKGAEDKDERYALRPEGTAGAVRSYIQNGMSSLSQPVKLFYTGSMFRHDRPQKGRYREFMQIGVEIFGDSTPKSDYLCIMSAWELFKRIGLKDLVVYMNSIGCPKCRPKYTTKLKKYYKDNLKKMCDSCQARYEGNPLRLLDCKEEVCQRYASGAPNILDSLCTDCKSHFQSVLEYLDYFNIKYDLDPKLVRGLDYYTNTVFEIAEVSDTKRQGALGGGGRYNGLVELLGGAKTPAVGYALGMDRIVTLMKEKGVETPDVRGVEISILQLGEKAKEASKKVYDLLSAAGINVYFVPSNDTLRSQLRGASKLRAKYAVIIGQTEAMKDDFILRDLKAGAQETIPVKYVVEEVKKRLYGVN